MLRDPQSTYEHATSSAYFADLDREAARETFVADRTRDIYAETLASDAAIEELMCDVFGHADITDAMFRAVYRNDTSAFRALVEKVALKDAELKADSEALERFK